MLREWRFLLALGATGIAGALFVFAGMAVSELPGRSGVLNARAHRGPKGR